MADIENNTDTMETSLTKAMRTETSPERGEANAPSPKSNGTFLKIIGAVAALAVIVLIIVLPVYFLVIVPDENEDVITVPADAARFDCHPESEATEASCTAKGCMWAPVVSDPNAPNCFYADNDGYMLAESPVSTPNGYTVNLQNNKPSERIYPGEFSELTVTVTRMTKEALRIHITPPNTERFEVPWEHHAPETLSAEEALYDIKFVSTSGGLFGIQIMRKATGKIIFDSSAGRMTFADQFLQLSTFLPSQHIFGFGEHMHETFKHDMQWRSHGMFSRDQGVGPNANLYGVHPFYMCMEGDGNAHGAFFLNSNAQDVTLQPTPALTYRTVGGLFDIYLFVGPGPEQVVSQYTATIGRPYVPPYWALGFQLCRYGYGSLDNLKKVVDRNLAAEIPYDVQYTDIDYMDRQLDFTINATTYAGLEDFARDLKNTHKMKYIIIFDPAISGNETAGKYPPWDLGKENDVFISTPNEDIAFGKVWPDLPGIYVNTSWDWDSQTATFRAYTAFPDFFKPITKEWWLNLTVDFHKRLEFDGLWIDMNEPASFVHGSTTGCPSTKWDNPLPYHPHILGENLYDKTTCMSNLQHNPSTGRDERHYNMHSLYGWSQGEPTLDACRASTGERCMVISRSTFPGSGKYVGHWLGDNSSLWSHLRASIIGMLEFNLFGIPYIGADICGFFQDTNEELCMRWMQLGAFYPFSRNHNGIYFKDQDPAVFGPKFISATKKILEVRYTMLPYFYTLFYDSNTIGGTVIRSLMAEFPTDETTYTIDRQFLLGGHILISPAMEPSVTSVQAYVPDARWYDYYTGVEIPSGLRKSTTSFNAPWDHLPIHVRGGSIIPLQTPARTTELQHSNPFGVLYAIGEPSAHSTGHLFWDDGNSIDTYANGKYILVEFEGTQEKLSSMVSYDGYEGSSSMVIDHVIIMGIASDEIAAVLVNDIAHGNYTFDSSTKMLKIEGLGLPLNANWNIVWDKGQYISRFNCHPEMAVSATEERCKARDCQWDPVDIPMVPSCFYPNNYGAYKKDTAPKATELGEELFLERLKRSELFGNAVQRLKVEVQTQSDHQLRIKIFDPNTVRYEVPLNINGMQTERPNDMLYEVIYQDEPFSFKVIRRSTREVIMDTSVGALVFEDQFLQISSTVSTTHLYGFGEAEHENYQHDFYWKTQGLHARDEGVKQDANLYGYHPFHMTMEKNGDAHGILLLTSNPMEISLTPLPSITYRTIGGILDFYIFLGPSPEQVVQQYSQAIGLPMMPPYWSLGFQLCKYGYGSLQEVQKVVDGMRGYEIPYDVQYGDIDYMERQLDFTIDPVHYAGLSEYVDILRDNYTMRYVMILDPAISANESRYAAYDEGVTDDVFVKGEDGRVIYGIVWPDLPGTLKNESTLDTRAHVAFPDFFKPETTDWWKRQIMAFYSDKLKFDGIWIDMNEPASFVDGRRDGGCTDDNKYDHPPYIPKTVGNTLFSKTICMSSRQYNLVTKKDNELHYNVHSLYGWSQAEPTMNACRDITGKRCYVISRSTYPGAGKYTGHWLGDNTSKWSHLRSSIIGMFEFGLFGISYTGADICGFFGDAEEEMCLRWSQLGAFYPFSRNHAMLDSRRQDPAAWGPNFAAAVKNVLETRYTLLPYLYTLHFHSHTTGSTVVRPMMHEFTSDKRTWGIDKQFLWGQALLITPVLEADKTAVEAYMPNARWFDYYSGMDVAVRGATVVLSAPKEHINLHVRGGNIIPTQKPAVTTYLSRQNDFGLIVALDDDNKASGNLYWDDGESIESITGKKYIYSNFMCDGNVLENRIIHDGYVNSSQMTLGSIIVMGLRDDVSRVFQGTEELSKSSFVQDSITKMLHITTKLDMSKEYMIRWEVGEEWLRFDCMPDLQTETTRSECERRGCLWRSSTTPRVPSCFYSSDVDAVHGYEVVSTETDGKKDNFTLRRLNTPSIYGDDVEMIQLSVEYQTKNRLHFKLHDPQNNRWEIPESAKVLASSKVASSDPSTALYNVTIINKPFAIRVSRKDGEIMFDSSVSALTFADQFLQISTKLPSLNLYGFGEHNHRRYRHDFNWKRWAMFTRDVAPVDDWNLYGHQTFFMAMMDSNDGRAFGLYLHNTNAMDITLQPTPAVTYRVTGGVLDFYLFVGDSPEEVVQEYHQLIGLPVMPPYWALGFQLSRWDYGSLKRVKEVVDDMKAAKIPFDVQYGDIDYMDAKKAFTYDHTTYAGLPEYVKQLHAWGMRYIIILDPGIKIESGYDAYDKGIESDIFVKDPSGSKPVLTEVWPGETYHPDYTHPNTLDWWYEQCFNFYNGDEGVEYDALWIDMNEPANFQPDDDMKLQLMNCTGKYNHPPYMPRILRYWVGLHDKSVCMDNQQHMGMHYNVHSLYGHSMSVVTYEALQNLFPEKRSLVLTRSTFAGSGKYAGHWLGDNQSLWPQMAWSIPGMFEFGLFGFPFIGADVCGFYYNTTYEMCQRWMQVGAFYPFSRNHNAAGMNPQHPTAFGTEFADNSRKILNIRYTILPYMYTLFHEVNVNGGTLVRALVHEFPHDSMTWNRDRQFLVGPAFLVTPVLDQGAMEVTAYFPPDSRWFDYYTGMEILATGKFIYLDAPMDYINLHVRGGYIIPMQKPNVTTTLSRKQPLSLLVVLDSNGDASGNLYWDDGEARDVDEIYTSIDYTCSMGVLTLNRTHESTSSIGTDMLVYDHIKVFGMLSTPGNVTVDNEATDFRYISEMRVLEISNLEITFEKESTVVKWM